MPKDEKPHDVRVRDVRRTVADVQPEVRRRVYPEDSRDPRASDDRSGSRIEEEEMKYGDRDDRRKSVVLRAKD